MKTHQVVQNSPLLYIVQPKLEPTVSYMQKSFRRQNEKVEKAEEENDYVSETAVTEIERYLKEAFQLKSFREMMLDEKLRFLTNLPQHLSAIKCKLTTKQRDYEGFIDRYKNEQVIFKTIADNEKISIPTEQIVSISLIGLRADKQSSN